MDDEIILIAVKTGRMISAIRLSFEKTKRAVICKVQSVDRQEFFKAGQRYESEVSL